MMGYVFWGVATNIDRFRQIPYAIGQFTVRPALYILLNLTYNPGE